MQRTGIKGGGGTKQSTNRGDSSSTFGKNVVDADFEVVNGDKKKK
ncbi:MAG TPA: hypothetical protein VK673_17700 [Chthoniobacterales bacterium]|nr:hypothetical protein [Chthoniobacterales bacterium]